MRQVMRTTLRSALIAAGLGCAAMVAPVITQAASPSTQYQQDVQRCNTTPGIDKKACLREAGAALEASRRDKLTTPSAQSEDQNRVRRCEALPADQRQDCMELMTQPNVREEGSVDSGGVLRETTITIPAPAVGS